MVEVCSSLYSLCVEDKSRTVTIYALPGIYADVSLQTEVESPGQQHSHRHHMCSSTTTGRCPSARDSLCLAWHELLHYFGHMRCHAIMKTTSHHSSLTWAKYAHRDALLLGKISMYRYTGIWFSEVIDSTVSWSLIKSGIEHWPRTSFPQVLPSLACIITYLYICNCHYLIKSGIEHWPRTSFPQALWERLINPPISKLDQTVFKTEPLDRTAFLQQIVHAGWRILTLH